MSAYVEEEYHALICYAKEDLQFVRELLRVLEGPRFGLRLCVDARDLDVGSYRIASVAELMETRCRYIVLILSPDFMVTGMCQFQKEYAQCLDADSQRRRIIPIMYRQCAPGTLSIMRILEYNSPEPFRPFWEDLHRSLTSTDSYITYDELRRRRVRPLSSITTEVPTWPASKEDLLRQPIEEVTPSLREAEIANSQDRNDEEEGAINICAIIPPMASLYMNNNDGAAGCNSIGISPEEELDESIPENAFFLNETILNHNVSILSRSRDVLQNVLNSGRYNVDNTNMNWLNLAVAAGVDILDTPSENQASHIISQWIQQSNAIVEDLLKVLKLLELFDILKNRNFIKALMTDACAQE